MSDRALLSKDEVARWLGVSRATLDRLRAAGRFPRPVGLDRRPRWRRADVERWLAGLRPGR